MTAAAWWDEEPAAAASKEPQQSPTTTVGNATRAVKRPFKSQPIPAADAWLVFRAVPAAGDPDGPCDHVEDLRVVRGRDLSGGAWRKEPRDFDWDIPLLRPWLGKDGDKAPPGGELPPPPAWLGGDPATDAAAAWRLFCGQWRVGPDAYEAIACVEGLEWATDMARWARKEAAA